MSEEGFWWKLTAYRGGCVMCRLYPVARAQRAGREPELRRIEGHHVLSQQQLRREGHGDRLWDVRNGIGLCAYHHHRHENHVQRVPRQALPPVCVEFALELDLEWLLDREYPPTAVQAVRSLL